MKSRRESPPQLLLLPEFCKINARVQNLPEITNMYDLQINLRRRIFEHAAALISVSYIL